MKIDSHQHFWSYDEKQYPWIPKGSPLHRDWLPADWVKEASKVGLDGSIAVQARQTLDESRWLLNLADHFPSIKGVVGWVDLRSERVGEQLTEFSRHPKFVAVRHVVQDESDDQFMVRPEFLRGVALLKEFKLAYDILIFPKQLPAAIELAKRFPDQPFVLDHIAKPLIKHGTISPWREQIRELAKAPNVLCKASGMVTEGFEHDIQIRLEIRVLPHVALGLGDHARNFAKHVRCFGQLADLLAPRGERAVFDERLGDVV